MPRVKDPVCDMMLDSESAVDVSRYEGKAWYFDSTECKRAFDENPARYTSKVSATPADLPSDETLEKHEPPYTKTGGWLSPKFGSAGSGGAEYERLPEAHDGKDRTP